MTWAKEREAEDDSVSRYIEAAWRNIPLKVLVLCNGKAETTGGQRIPDGALECVVKGYKDHVSYIHDPQNSDEVEDILGKATTADELRLVIADFRKKRKRALVN